MKKLINVFALLLLLVGCTQTAVEEPTPLPPTNTPTAVPTETATAVPTDTPTAVPTNTPTPTQTPSPTATATPTETPLPAIILTELITLTAGGFAFQPIEGYVMEHDAGQMFMSSADGAIIFSMAGAWYEGAGADVTVEEVINDYLDEVAATTNGNFKQANLETITVDNVTGTAVNLTGQMLGVKVEGQALYFNPYDNQIVFALALAMLADDPDLWQREGGMAWTAVVNSLRFFEIEAPVAPPTVESGSCTVSTDSSYGYTSENPILIGGDAFGGPSRQRAYLDNLLGPNGEPVTYTRLGSVPTDSTILDIYAVTYANQTIELYIDSYNWDVLSVPVGFSCTGPIPVSAP